MKKSFYSIFVLAIFAIGFAASDETESSEKSEGKDVTKDDSVSEEPIKDAAPEEDPDVKHFVGDYFYSYFLGDTNAKMYFKLSLNPDGKFTLEPTNDQTKEWMNINKVMSGYDYSEGGYWEVKDTSAGKGAFLDFDGDWGKGSITYDRKVLGINNMNGYNLKAELKYEAPKVLPKVPDSPEAMIKEFYKYVLGEKEMDEDILDAYLTKDMKQSLWTEDYEGCYEFWRFRTSAQDYDPEVGNISKVKEVKSDGNYWYTVSYMDMGYEGLTIVKVVNSKIVELKPDKSWDGWDE